MIQRYRIPTLLSLAVLLLPGCQVRTVVVSSPFTTELTVTPLEVAAGSGFSVVLAVTNLAEKSIELTSPNGCIASLVFDHDGSKIPLAGSNIPCVAATTSFEFEPGEIRLFNWEVRAELDGRSSGFDGRAMPSPGDYRVTANLHVELPAATNEFVITAPVVEPRLPTL